MCGGNNVLTYTWFHSFLFLKQLYTNFYLLGDYSLTCLTSSKNKCWKINRFHPCPPEYLSLQKTLYNLKLPTESLIAKYYRERHEELLRAHSCSAELVVRVGALWGSVNGCCRLTFLPKVFFMSASAYVSVWVDCTRIMFGMYVFKFNLELCLVHMYFCWVELLTFFPFLVCHLHSFL